MQSLLDDGSVQLADRGVGVIGNQPFPHVGEALQAVGILSAALRNEVVVDAEIRGAMQQRPVYPGVVQLRRQHLGVVCHVGEQGRQHLLAVQLAAGTPLQPAVPGGTKLRPVHRVQIERTRQIGESVAGARASIATAPRGLKVMRGNELQQGLELVSILEPAVASKIRDAVCVPVVDHRPLPARAGKCRRACWSGHSCVKRSSRRLTEAHAGAGDRPAAVDAVAAM